MGKMISVVMTYKKDGGMRDRHYAFIQDWYKKILPEAEVIIEEQTVHEGEKFYRSGLINRGAEKAKGEVLFITDIDILIQREDILKAVNLLDGKIPMVYPFGYILYSTEQQAEKILQIGKVDFSRQAYSHVRTWYTSTTRPSGINVILKKDFMQYGGYDERYEYWGSEDGAFLRMIETMKDGLTKRMQNSMVHLWHPKAPNLGKNRDTYNAQFTRQYDKAYGNKQEMQKIINEAVKGKGKQI